MAAAPVVPEDALEPALRAILEASRAQAGALCLFDQRHGVLRLVAEIGFSEEGCRRLRNVRRSDPTAWDMPLNGLMNRRAYLIESASRNRYVPRLVEHAAAVRTIACVPLHAGPTPVGSLVLVALAPRSFAERDVRMLERPLAELAVMIEAGRRRGAPGGAGEGPETPGAPPPRSPPPSGPLSGSGRGWPHRSRRRRPSAPSGRAPRWRSRRLAQRPNARRQARSRSSRGRAARPRPTRRRLRRAPRSGRARSSACARAPKRPSRLRRAPGSSSTSRSRRTP